MEKLHYFTYGSNLHPLRLQERVLSAKVTGVVEAKGRKLTFSKKSNDNSGKCSFYETKILTDIVFGVLYEIDPGDKGSLDRAEGKGKGYNEQLLSFELDGKAYTPFTYIADSKHIDSSLQPYEWYKQFVLEGARYHSMHEEYISSLEAVVAIPDPDTKRNSENIHGLYAMKEFNRLNKGTPVLKAGVMEDGANE